MKEALEEARSLGTGARQVSTRGSIFMLTEPRGVDCGTMERALGSSRLENWHVLRLFSELESSITLPAKHFV